MKEQLSEITNKALLGELPEFLIEECKKEALEGNYSAKVRFFDLSLLKNKLGKIYFDKLSDIDYLNTPKLKEFFNSLVDDLRKFMNMNIIQCTESLLLGNNPWLVLKISWRD